METVNTFNLQNLKSEIVTLFIYAFLADLADLMRPSLVAPVVAWLCHEDCQDNGSVIEAAGGWAGKCEWLDFCNQME